MVVLPLEVPLETSLYMEPKTTKIEMQVVRDILNTINMNILPTITDFSFRDKIVEIVFANLTETLEMEEKFLKK